MAVGRYEKLQAVLKRALDEVDKEMGVAAFREALGGAAREEDVAILTGSMLRILRSNVMLEFESISEGYGLAEKLGRLDRLLAEQEEVEIGGEVVRRPRPSPHSTRALRAQLVAARKTEAADLKELLDSLQAGNEALRKEADALNKKASAIHDKMAKALAASSSAADSAERFAEGGGE